MAYGYYILELDVVDPEKMAAYRELVGPTLKEYGGEVLVAGSRHEHLEGDPPPLPRVVVVRFPNYDRALDWYRSETYAPALQMRLEAATSRGYVVEGLA
jgi:uncharacterized protein (DUF1330 family)